MTTRLEPIRLDADATLTLLQSWNRLPALYEAGPLFVIATSPQDDPLRASELVRRLAIEQSVGAGNEYWCCARPKLDDQPFARANESALGFLDFWDRAPALPFLWIEFPDARQSKVEIAVLQAIQATVQGCRKRAVGRFEDRQEQWRNIGRQVGEALGTSTFDAIVEAWAPSAVGSAQAGKLAKGGIAADAVETAVDFVDEVSTGPRQSPEATLRRAAALAGECLETAKACSLAAWPTFCRANYDEPLFPRPRLPLVISVEKIEWQGIGCVEFLRAILAACLKDPWPVLIVTTCDDARAAKPILCLNIQPDSASLRSLDARVFETIAEPNSAPTARGALAPPRRLKEVLDEAQVFGQERARAIAEDRELPDGTDEAIRLHNEIARCAGKEFDPRFPDVMFGLLAMALSGTVQGSWPMWQQLAILELGGLQFRWWVEAASKPDVPRALVDLVADVELMRLKDLWSRYCLIVDVESVRALCAEDGPLFRLDNVYQQHGLDELPLFRLFEDYLYDLARFRPAALRSSELRGDPVRERVVSAHREMTKAFAIRSDIRLALAQLHSRKYREALETLANAAVSNAESGASEEEVKANARAIASITTAARKRTEATRRDIEGGMLRETLKLLGSVWSKRPLTP